jgi:DNA-binding GntR family transcriptional regulator
LKEISLRRAPFRIKTGLAPGDQQDPGQGSSQEAEGLHFFIIDRAGNRKLEQLVKTLSEQIEMSRVYSYYKQRKVSVDEHTQIASALKERDLEKSQASLEEHFKMRLRC